MVRTFDFSREPVRAAGGDPRPQKGRGGGKRGRPKNALDGWIVLDKPRLGLTPPRRLGAGFFGFLVVGEAAVLCPDKAGPPERLDPLASGLLPLALGEATKTVPLRGGR